MSEKAKQPERRQFGRRHTQDRGWISLPGRPALPCIVRNISDGGALLVFDRPEHLPFGFRMSIEGQDKIYGCEVRHHYGERVGVAFVDLAMISESTTSAYGGAVGSWIGPKNVTRHP